MLPVLASNCSTPGVVGECDDPDMIGERFHDLGRERLDRLGDAEHHVGGRVPCASDGFRAYVCGEEAPVTRSLGVPTPCMT